MIELCFMFSFSKENIMAKHKHLDLDDRYQIKSKLDAGCSFRFIAKALHKSPSTISLEVRKHRIPYTKGVPGRKFNNCKFRKNCKVQYLCGDAYKDCTRANCSSCPHHYCHPRHCSFYEKEDCPLLEKPPYVCNGCLLRRKCTLTKYEYVPLSAQENYKLTLSESREGFSLLDFEVQALDDIVSSAIKRGLSPHTVYAANKNILPCSERTIYRLVEAGKLEAKSLDLPFKVRYKPRRIKKNHKIDTKCRLGRTYVDFLKFLDEENNPAYVQMDTIIGKMGGKCILSFYFEHISFVILLLRESNNAASVIAHFNQMDADLGREDFEKFFKICLTDNGTEFSNPNALELDSNGLMRARIFYCDPGVPNQKAGVESIHKHVRRILPKGTSFDALTQEDLNLISSNLNSLPRKRLNNQCPIDLFNLIYGSELLHKLNINRIDLNELCLNTHLLKK